MGEPATPTPAELAATLELARRIVEAVRDDEEWPKLGEGRARYNPFCSDLDEPSSTAVFQLAQALTIAASARPIVDAAIAVYRSGHTNDANCAAGDHDDCTQPAALRRLLVAVEAHVKGGERCE